MSTFAWITLVLGLVAAAAGALVYWRVRQRRPGRRVAKLAPRLRHPVVLAHGIMGFDQMKVGPLKNQYFRGIEPRLTKLGAQVYAFRVNPLGGVAARAEELRRAVEAIDAKQVNIIAHSMGGLDARYAVSVLGMKRKVASITTIGTPHRGTPLADLGTSFLGVGPVAKRALEAMGVDVNGFFDLTTARMLTFNQSVADVPGVWYGSWVARASRRAIALNPLLLPTWKLIPGENDGLVPATSQQWGEVCGAIEADHWAQIGWSVSFDAGAFYEDVVRDLMRRGF